MQAIHYQNDARWNYPVNLYPFHTLYAVLDGDGFVRIGKEVVALQPGHAYLIPANTVFSCWCKSHINKVYIEFFAQTQEGVDMFFGLNRMTRQPLAEESQLCFTQACQRGTLRDQVRFEGELLRTVAQFITESAPRPSREALRLRPVLDDIARNPGANIHLHELALRHGWNPSTLSRCFSRVFSFTLKQYTERLLVNVLKHELLLTDRTLSDLAAQYHFCDGYYLSNFFKRHMGMSPEVFRRQHRDSMQKYPKPA